MVENIHERMRNLQFISFSMCWYSFQYGDVSPDDSLLILIYNFDPAKRANNSSGLPTTPTPMPKSVQINFLKSNFNLNLKSLENPSPHTWCDGLIYRPDLRSYQTYGLTRILDA
jgi:hypothetical protein